jgi:hypothetical protein
MIASEDMTQELEKNLSRISLDTTSLCRTYSSIHPRRVAINVF